MSGKAECGPPKEKLIILAARPAVGKTAFALNIAQNVATRADQVVAIFSGMGQPHFSSHDRTLLHSPVSRSVFSSQIQEDPSV